MADDDAKDLWSALGGGADVPFRGKVDWTTGSPAPAAAPPAAAPFPSPATQPEPAPDAATSWATSAEATAAELREDHPLSNAPQDQPAPWAMPATPPQDPAPSQPSAAGDDGLSDLFADAPAPSATAPSVPSPAPDATDSGDAGLADLLFGDDEPATPPPAPAQAPAPAAPVPPAPAPAPEPGKPPVSEPAPDPEPSKAPRVRATPPADVEAGTDDPAPSPAPKAAPAPKPTPAAKAAPDAKAAATKAAPAKSAPAKDTKPAAKAAPAEDTATPDKATEWKAAASSPAPARPEPKTAPTTVPADAATEARKSRVAARRAAAARAEAALDRAKLAEEAATRAHAQRYLAAAHLHPIVSRVLGLVAADHSIQAVVNRFQLTRDHMIDRQQRRDLEEIVAPRVIDAQIPIGNPKELPLLFDMVYDELLGISVLGEFWRDDEITEICVDAWNSITVERNGVLVRTPAMFRDREHADGVARALAQKVSDRALTPVTPLVTAELDGARVTFAYRPVVKTGLSITMRKFVPLLGVNALIAKGAMTDEMSDFLRDCVIAKANIMVSGGTGTGKTTMVNALSESIPDHERVVTIEDAFELALSNQHVVALQTKEAASADDRVSITQDMLLVNTLRMRPDRIIVGEIRESKGATVMLAAANTGHDGTMSTIHANSADRALNFRLAGWVRTGAGMPNEVACAEVAGAINLIVQVTRRHGRRFISDIAVVDPRNVHDGLIVTQSLFTGSVALDDNGDAGEPTFRRVASVGADTELGMKLADAGVDTLRWIES